MNRTLSLCGLLVFLSSAGVARAQEVSFSPQRWEIRAQESRIEEHLGRPSLYLKNGHAYVNDSAFTDGIIEFDMAVTGERGFMGAIWRVQDPRNFEEFYIRPHQSGNPDANQYTPAFHGLTSWQLYHGEGYGAPVRYRLNEWIPIRIVVAGSKAEIYVDDMEKPAVFVRQLKREIRAGRVGLSSNTAGVHFSCFRFTPMATPPPLKSADRPAAVTAPGTILAWSVSDAFDEKSLEGKHLLSATDKAARTWTALACEDTGLANLARIQGIAPGKNTVFARVTIVSEGEQVKKLKFGFSDRVKIYFNDRLLYAGNNNYRSRDYRFLGTIGYFDELYLPLQAGENHLWLAVSEDFGGWGIQAMFDDPSGIRVK